MTQQQRFRGGAVFLVGCMLAACSPGNGSDIGPTLRNLPNSSCKVVVLDDFGRGVVEAAVTIVGSSARALTGRNGRGDLTADPRGRQLVDVDGSLAAAASGDRLAALRLAATIVGPDLPSVIHLPDLPDSASGTVSVGTQTAATALTSTAGGVLTVPIGCSVGLPGGAATVTLRTGALWPTHLPGDLPIPANAPPAATLLFGAGFYVDPPSITFAPAADLDLADDLGLGTATAQLYHLDQTTGEWSAVATGAMAVAGRIQLAGAVATGGLFAFAAPTPATVVSGRVVDTAGAVVPDVLVRVDNQNVVTDRNGRFVANGVAATLADLSVRSASLELFAGGGWLPAQANFSVDVLTAPVDVGDLVLDTMSAGNLRVQQVLRGRAETLRPARISSLLGDVALVATGDSFGQALFEDLPADWFGYQEGRVIDQRSVYYGQSFGFLDRGKRWQDAYQFFFERDWYLGARRTRAIVSDALGGGPLRDAAIVRGSGPNQGFVGMTQESGTLFVDRDFSGRATASRRSERDGRSIVHAFTIERPNGEHLELPLQRVLRAPLAAFDRHGLVAGTLLGADLGREHALRATRRLSQQEWWGELVEDAPLAASLPLDIDPAATHGAFQVGVPNTGGNLAAVETTVVDGITTLEKFGFVADLEPTEGALSQQDIELGATGQANFGVAEALVEVPAGLVVADLRLALALQQPSGRVVDVARDLGGNHRADAFDLAFQLPALTGPLADHRWLALLQGSWSVGGYPGSGSLLSISSLVSLPRPAVTGAFPAGQFQFLDFPEVTSPATGDVVSASGFPVAFSLPSWAMYGTIELRSSGSETLLWQVLVPKDLTQFSFVQLPTEAVTPLVAGRSYTLTVSAYAGQGPLQGSEDPYRDLSTFVQSIGAIERGVNQVARRTLSISTN